MNLIQNVIFLFYLFAMAKSLKFEILLFLSDIHT